MKKKILINTPDINKIGGVANFYLALNGKYSNRVRYNFIGGRSKKSNYLITLFMDYIKFLIIIVSFKPQLVHLNPSLDKKSILRDSIYVLISKLFFRKTLIFWHGWQEYTELIISNKYSKIFKFIFNLSDAHCVLASDFKKSLRKWGISKPVYLETTIYNDAIMKGFDLRLKEFDHPKILFLSRIEEQKGIYIALDSFKIISKKFKNVKMLIAGTGKELNKVKEYVINRKIKNIEFLGFVTDEKKSDVIQSSLIYFFPTYHGEGMPISILESMACGSIIVTRPMGGIKDFFEDEKMGFITESKDPKVYAELLTKLLKDRQKLQAISKYNHEYAKERFSASKVADRLEKIYDNIINP